MVLRLSLKVEASRTKNTIPKRDISLRGSLWHMIGVSWYDQFSRLLSEIISRHLRSVNKSSNQMRRTSAAYINKRAANVK